MTGDTERIYEQILVLRCQAGDEGAFEELVGRYSPRLRYYLGKMLGVTSADDILQDVWLDAVKSITRLAQPAAFSTWLYRIARDRAFRELRKRRVRPRSIQDADFIDDTIEEDAFSAEDSQQIHKLLDQLAPEHREVLVLRFLENMTYEEITRVTGSQLGTVKSRIHYAKRAMRLAMERTNSHG
jgi:RNA polymerase sigma-70 factor, ECF subfamily